MARDNVREKVQVERSAHEGLDLIDVRVWEREPDGRWQATARGISLPAAVWEVIMPELLALLGEGTEEQMQRSDLLAVLDEGTGTCMGFLLADGDGTEEIQQALADWGFQLLRADEIGQEDVAPILIEGPADVGTLRASRGVEGRGKG